MATVTKPIALDESLHTSETPSRNIADVLAQELSGISTALTTASNTKLHLYSKLWENPVPTSSMVADTAINLSSDDYDFLLTTWRLSASNPLIFSSITPKGDAYIGMVHVGSYLNGGQLVYERYLRRVSNLSFVAESESQSIGSNTPTSDDSRVIPYVIYGFKKSVDINAIVSSVSTDADKCMMSDGVTTVEQAITANNLSSSNVVSSGVEFMCPSDGYLQIRIGSGKEMIVRIYGHNKTQYITYDYKNASNTGNYEVIYVRKGMYIQSTYANEDGHIYFYPLV